MSGADVLALVTGGVGVISLAAGIWFTVRAVRSKERKTHKDEVEQLRTELADERQGRIDCELDRHNLKIKLAENGIDPDG